MSLEGRRTCVLGVVCVAIACLTLAAAVAAGPARSLPPSRLSVRVDGVWREWWRAADAPVRWPARDAALAAQVRWRAASEGIEWGELALGGTGEGWRTRLVLVRLDPTRLRLALDTAFTPEGRAAWSLDRVPSEARFAVNAGQFLLSLPWGWVVLDGDQFLAPGNGPLVTTIVIDSGGAVHWRHAGAPEPRRAPAARWAFQSYPTMLVDRTVPPPLRAGGGGVDVTHRDARAAIGRLSDGRLIVALTRFDALGGALGFVPLGLTVPEMAAVMAAVGATDAVSLDGGISAQMIVRESEGARRWPGLRTVPLALVAYPLE